MQAEKHIKYISDSTVSAQFPNLFGASAGTDLRLASGGISLEHEKRRGLVTVLGTHKSVLARGEQARAAIHWYVGGKRAVHPRTRTRAS